MSFERAVFGSFSLEQRAYSLFVGIFYIMFLDNILSLFDMIYNIPHQN